MVLPKLNIDGKPIANKYYEEKKITMIAPVAASEQAKAQIENLFSTKIEL